MNCANSSLLLNPSRTDMRILIAEDDLTTRTILAGVLKKWGYDVEAVKDGLAAWEVLQQPDPPRLVILDWMMPGMDGLEVIQLVRTHLPEPPPYIILLSSKDQKGDIISGLETGANDYVIKPFDNEELFARIRAGQRTIELQTRLFETQQILAHLATHDPLTGILNRRAILDQLSKELSRAHRECNMDGDEILRPKKELCIGYFDIDHFKQINDQYGHQSGDEVLKGIVGVFSSQLRAYDTFGRLGGDEFLVVSPGGCEENYGHVFERLLAAIANGKIMTGAGEVSITVSIGVAFAAPGRGLDQLLDTADMAMYRAKQEGGNRVVYA
jgi:two-component system, cell cycle response regulator